MSVEDLNIIDFISTNKYGDIVLTISDHLEWDFNNEHLLILQKKLNAYLGFIESGELKEKYPHGENKDIIINVVAKYKPNHDGNIFLKKTEEKIKSFGYNFLFTIKSE